MVLAAPAKVKGGYHVTQQLVSKVSTLKWANEDLSIVCIVALPHNRQSPDVCSTEEQTVLQGTIQY